MPDPIRVAINGANGRMGQALQALLQDDPRFRLTATVDVPNGWPDAQLDVVIDFSAPSGLAAALKHCVDRGVALISGTTGLDPALRNCVADAAESIPVLAAANFSLGVAVLVRVVREAAAALPGWDLEVVEAHHARKVDAPSGTALALGRAAAAAREQDFDGVAVRARDGQVGARPTGAIGFASIRAGDIVGEHTALLATAGERLEFTHRATDRAIFARGALAAAAWIAGRNPGLYTLDDMLAAG